MDNYHVTGSVLEFHVGTTPRVVRALPRQQPDFLDIS